MKPSTQKVDAEVWKHWSDGIAPKDIARDLGLTVWQVYKALGRERWRRNTRPKRAKKGKTGRTRYGLHS